MRSSQDGGVIWTGVPTGTYRISAHHPTTRFASFVATCRPGRIVNANPPWGLHELGLANPARVAATWAAHGTACVLRSLRATRLPAARVVGVRCTGRACPFRARTLRASRARRSTSGAALGPRARGALRAGQTLYVAGLGAPFDGTLVRWAVRRRGVRGRRRAACRWAEARRVGPAEVGRSPLGVGGPRRLTGPSAPHRRC